MAVSLFILLYSNYAAAGGRESIAKVKLEVGIFSGYVPKVKNLDQSLVIMKVVIDTHRGVENLANTRSSGDEDSKPGEILEEVDVV
jgi:hypothetical protein